MKVLYSPSELKRMSAKKILRILQSHGHPGWQVGPESMSTPGGAARINALTYSWAKNYPLVHWSPGDIQLENELAGRVMKQYGFKPEKPILPILARAVRRYGVAAWRHKSKGIKAVQYKIPSGRYREEADEYNPAAGDTIRAYWDDSKDIIVVYVTGPGRAVAFCPTPAQWRRLQKYHAQRPMRISAKQIIPGWRPKSRQHKIFIG